MSFKELFEASLCIETNKWNNDTLAEVPNCKGVLLFVDSRHQPIQLLISANIRKLVANRIEQLSEDQLSKRSNIMKVASHIYYKRTWNDFRTRLFYSLAARQCFSDTYNEWIDLPKPHFVVLDKTTKCPCFQITERPKFYKSQPYLYGLFPNRKTADHYCYALNTVHGLCRNPSIACSTKTNSCTYFQMKQCSGFCMGKISKQTYLGHVEKAFHFSTGSLKPSDYINNLKPQMKHFGRTQEYEKAQQVKNRIELLKSLNTASYHWTGFLKSMDVFHLDRSKKIDVEGIRKKQQSYDLFRITWNCIHLMENVLSENLEIALDKILDKPDIKLEFTKDKVSEHLANVSRFIYKKNSNGLWIVPVQSRDLLDRIHETFPETL